MSQTAYLFSVATMFFMTSRTQLLGLLGRIAYLLLCLQIVKCLIPVDLYQSVLYFSSWLHILQRNDKVETNKMYP